MLPDAKGLSSNSMLRGGGVKVHDANSFQTMQPTSTGKNLPIPILEIIPHSQYCPNIDIGNVVNPNIGNPLPIIHIPNVNRTIPNIGIDKFFPV